MFALSLLSSKIFLDLLLMRCLFHRLPIDHETIEEKKGRRVTNGVATKHFIMDSNPHGFSTQNRDVLEILNDNRQLCEAMERSLSVSTLKTLTFTHKDIDGDDNQEVKELLLRLLKSRRWDYVSFGQGTGYQEILQTALQQIDCCCATLCIGGFLDGFDFTSICKHHGRTTIGETLTTLDIQDMYFSVSIAVELGDVLSTSNIQNLKLGGVLFENRRAAVAVASGIVKAWGRLKELRFFSHTRFADGHELVPPFFEWDPPASDVDDESILLLLEAISVLSEAQSLPTTTNDGHDSSDDKKNLPRFPEISISILRDTSTPQLYCGDIKTQLYRS